MSVPELSDIVAAETRRLSQGAPVQVVMTDGVAVLRGEVPDARRRRLIEQGLLLLPEVRDVRNYLRVANPPGDVVCQLRAVLQREGVRVEDLAIDSADGALTLTGRAAGWFDRDAAERMAWTLPGVRAVDNRIVLPAGAVEPEPESGDGRVA